MASVALLEAGGNEAEMLRRKLEVMLKQKGEKDKEKQELERKKEELVRKKSDLEYRRQSRTIPVKKPLPTRYLIHLKCTCCGCIVGLCA